MNHFWRKFINLLLLITTLAVGITEVCERHYAAAVNQWHYCLSAACTKADSIKVFVFTIALIASFITVSSNNKTC